ncbi:MAG: hypothetical protein LBB17_01845 [Puniceicoccales bacterium]|jgi:hypothetical protein|nr:hypothetical protein [Puniceicoccales bacterium]
MGMSLENGIRTMHEEVKGQEAGATNSTTVIVNGRKCELSAKVEKTWFGLGTRTRFTLTPMDNRGCQVENNRTEFIYNKGKGIEKTIKKAEEEIKPEESSDDLNDIFGFDKDAPAEEIPEAGDTLAEERSDDVDASQFKCRRPSEQRPQLRVSGLPPHNSQPTASSTQAYAEASQASSEPPVLPRGVSSFIQRADELCTSNKGKRLDDPTSGKDRCEEIFAFLNEMEKFLQQNKSNLSKEDMKNLQKALNRLHGIQYDDNQIGYYRRADNPTLPNPKIATRIFDKIRFIEVKLDVELHLK